MRTRFSVTPERFRTLAYVTLAALTLIVLTGAAVRLTSSGLGCPDWPRCYGKALPPLSTHALIEFGNRAISGLVGVLTVVAVSAASVREHLAPGFVMGHFGLSMVVLIGAVALAWRSRDEAARGLRLSSEDRLAV